jgi:hypothetical protein
MDGWLNLAKFLTSTLGIPGAIIAGICAYLIYQLNQERQAREKDRAKIDEVNDKRVEILSTYLKAMNDFKVAIDALAAAVGKK